MKAPHGLFLALFFVLNAQGASVEGLKAYLDFDQNYQPSLEKIDNRYLVVVPEENYYDILSPEQERKFELALSLLEETLNSEEFKLKVLSYKRSDGKRLFQKNYLWNNETQKLTNEDVYNILMQGNEAAIPGTVGEMNIYSWVKKCRWYESWRPWCRKVIGSTNPSSDKWIKTNYNFYRSFEAPEMVNNIVHEWIHLLGFLHGREKMREEVPYVVGAIAQKVAQGLLENNLY